MEDLEDMARIIGLNRNHKKIDSIVMIVIIIVLLIVIYFIIKKEDNTLPFEKNITSIVITQEVEPHSIKVKDVSEFVKNMKADNWTKVEKYSLKSAPICYLNFEPSGDRIEIYLSDDDYTYACFNEQYYMIPIEAYNYIMARWQN